MRLTVSKWGNRSCRPKSIISRLANSAAMRSRACALAMPCTCAMALRLDARRFATLDSILASNAAAHGLEPAVIPASLFI